MFETLRKAYAGKEPQPTQNFYDQFFHKDGMREVEVERALELLDAIKEDKWSSMENPE